MRRRRVGLRLLTLVWFVKSLSRATAAALSLWQKLRSVRLRLASWLRGLFACFGGRCYGIRLWGAVPTPAGAFALDALPQRMRPALRKVRWALPAPMV